MHRHDFAIREKYHLNDAPDVVPDRLKLQVWLVDLDLSGWREEGKGSGDENIDQNHVSGKTRWRCEREQFEGREDWGGEMPGIDRRKIGSERGWGGECMQAVTWGRPSAIRCLYSTDRAGHRWRCHGVGDYRQGGNAARMCVRWRRTLNQVGGGRDQLSQTPHARHIFNKVRMCLNVIRFCGGDSCLRIGAAGSVKSARGCNPLHCLTSRLAPGASGLVVVLALPSLPAP